jgi:PAS domain S-box-containing protein
MNNKDTARILIVDDQIHALQGMSRIMRRAGYEILEASNGIDCLRLAAEHKPDLILLDVVLPDIDGLEVCKRIKSDPETSDIYVVLFSSVQIEPDDQAEGLEQGADGYISRPIPNRELLARVKSILRLKREQKILTETEERYRLLFQNMLEGCAYCKMLFDDKGHPDDWVYLDVNPAFEQLTGLENIVGQKVTEAIPGIKQAHPELFEIYGRVALTGESEIFEIDFKPLGIVLNISVFSATKEHFFAVLENITERKRAEEGLRESELLFRSMFENSMDGVLFTAPDGRIFMANPAACSILGRTETEICDAGRDGILDLTDPRLSIELEKRRRDGKIRCELNFRNKTGTVIPVELSSIIFNNSNDEQRTIITFRDITDRKRTEEEKEKVVVDLQKALSEVKKLSGFLPICSSCKKIRDDQGYWNEIERYISEHSETLFSHGICPDCMRKLYPKYADAVLGSLEKDEKE